MNADQIERTVEGAIAEMTLRADYVKRIAIDAEQRRERASDAGAELAAAVNRYLGSPASLGNDMLYAAYKRYMELHAGNFGPVTVDA